MINAHSAQAPLRVLARDNESAVINEFVSGAGATSALYVEGPAGIGKTTLWQSGVRLARERGMAVSSLVAVQAEVSLPFAGLHAIVDSMDPAAVGRLPASQRRTVESAIFGSGKGAGVGLGAAVLDLFRLAGQARPLLLAIDDLQWLDDASGRVLAFALRRLPDDPVRLLATVRTPDEIDDTVALPSHLQSVPHSSVPVGPLSPAELGEVIELHTGRRLREPVISRVHAAARGNCFHALELVRVLPVEARLLAGERHELPASLEFVTRQRIRARSPECRDLMLRVAAAMSAPPTLFASDETALAEATDHDLLLLDDQRLRFIHPLLRASVYQSTTPSQRRRAHGWLAKHVDDPAERLLHRALGADPPEPALAQTLEQASIEYRNHDRLELAAILMSQSCRLTPIADHESYARRGVAAGELHAIGGDFHRARVVLSDVIRALPAGPRRANALWWLSEIQTSFDDTLALSDQALREAGDDHGLRARVHGSAAVLASATGDYIAMAEHARAGLNAAERADNPNITVSALVRLGFSHMYRGLPPDPTLTRRAEALLPAAPGLMLNETPAMLRAVQLFHADDLAGAREILTTIGTRAEQNGDLASQGSVLLWSIPLEIAAGDGARAAALAALFSKLVAHADGAGWRAAELHLRASVEAFHGDHAAAIASATAASDLAIATTNQTAWLHAEIVAGTAESQIGEDERACERLGTVAAALSAKGQFNVAEYRVLVPLIESLIRTQRPAVAREHINDLERRARLLGAPASAANSQRLGAEIAAAEGDLTAALTRARDAVAAYRALPRPIDLATALRTLALILRRLRQKAESRDCLQEALNLVERTGASALTRTLEADLARTGLRSGRHARSEGVEHQVARLAARGLTNGQIARALHMSDKTVEAHLTRLYRRLGLRSRHDLIKRFGHTDDEA